MPYVNKVYLLPILQTHAICMLPLVKSELEVQIAASFVLVDIFIIVSMWLQLSKVHTKLCSIKSFQTSWMSSLEKIFEMDRYIHVDKYCTHITINYEFCANRHHTGSVTFNGSRCSSSSRFATLFIVHCTKSPCSKVSMTTFTGKNKWKPFESY